MIRKTPLVLVLCAWVVVAIPLGWGLYESVMKARPLFTTGETPVPSPQSVTAPSK